MSLFEELDLTILCIVQDFFRDNTGSILSDIPPIEGFNQNQIYESIYSLNEQKLIETNLVLDESRRVTTYNLFRLTEKGKKYIQKNSPRPVAFALSRSILDR